MDNKQIAVLGSFVLIAIVAGFIFYGLGKNQNNDNNLNLPLNLTNYSAKNPSSTPEVPNLRIEDIKIGTGSAVREGDTINVNYEGKLTNGSVFDSNIGKEPFTTQIGVGKVIRGWDEGLLGMKVGGIRRLTVPPGLGYGAQVVGSIPENSILIFDIELLKIEIPAASSPSPTPVD